MTYPPSHALVSTEWLADHLSAPDVRVVDATLYLPIAGQDGRNEYAREHIPGAVFFDINDIADAANPLPHMIPDAVKFASKVKRLGLGDGNRIIAYDHSSGGMGAARVWWMFRLFGHDDVSVLDGGIGKWLREGRPTEDLPPVPRERHFTPDFHPELVRTKAQLIANSATEREQTIDARSAPRFAGLEKEPWPYKKVGHIPGAKNLPWNLLIDPVAKTLVSPEQQARLFAEAGVDLAQPINVSCGSGVSSCLLALSLFLQGKADVAVYDGSWAEWGLADDTPVEPLTHA